MAYPKDNKQKGMEQYEVTCTECRGTGDLHWQDEYSSWHTDPNSCRSCDGTGTALPELEVEWVDANPPIIVTVERWRR